MSKPLLSIVVPCYNEAESVASFYDQLKVVLETLEDYNYELVYVNDGSDDDTYKQLTKLADHDDHVRVICLSRNFGKEIALTAGLQYAGGDAILSLDGDGQHPPTLIPAFVAAWRAGAQVVIGLRQNQAKLKLRKRLGSWLFYRVFNKFSGGSLLAGSTDFRLIDRQVQQLFLTMSEHHRLTRGLIDWLGFKPVYIPFQANERLAGNATYSTKKLWQLAVDSFVSLSLLPLYISLYLGLLLVPLAVIVGLFSAIEMVIGDPLKLHIHGTAFVAILILFAVGILLISQGLIALYVARIHTETQNRPLFVVDINHSHRLDT